MAGNSVTCQATRHVPSKSIDWFWALSQRLDIHGTRRQALYCKTVFSEICRDSGKTLSIRSSTMQYIHGKHSGPHTNPWRPTCTYPPRHRHQSLPWLERSTTGHRCTHHRLLQHTPNRKIHWTIHRFILQPRVAPVIQSQSSRFLSRATQALPKLFKTPHNK